MCILFWKYNTGCFLRAVSNSVSKKKSLTLWLGSSRNTDGCHDWKRWPLLNSSEVASLMLRTIRESKNVKMIVPSQCPSFFLLHQASGLPSLSSSRFHYWQSRCSHWAPWCTHTAAQLTRILLGQLNFWTGLDKLHHQMRLMLIRSTARGCTALLATVLSPNTHKMLFEYLKCNPHPDIFIPF